MPAESITQARAIQLLDHDPKMGELYWRVDRMGGARAGDPAGSVNSEGYIVIVIDGKRHRAHRIIWLMVYGRWPAFQIDHINHDRADNRLCNLREVADQTEQNKNLLMRSDNTTGVVGVVWHRGKHKYQAQLTLHGRCHYLGLFKSLDEATAVRKAAEVEHGFHRNHGAQL